MLATISLSKDGKKAIASIGTLEQLSNGLLHNEDTNRDVYLFKLSLFSRLAAMKPIQNETNLALPELFAKVKDWLSQQLCLTTKDQSQLRTDLIVDTLGYLCLKSHFKDALIESDISSFTNQLTA